MAGIIDPCILFSIFAMSVAGNDLADFPIQASSSKSIKPNLD